MTILVLFSFCLLPLPTHCRAGAATFPELAMHNGTKATNATSLIQPLRHAFANVTRALPVFLSDHLGRGYHSVVVYPIYRLYRQGPSLRGFGFWCGASSDDICAALTGIEAAFWRKNPERCEQRIYDDVRSYVILLETAIYVYVLVALVRWCVRLSYGTGRLFLRRRGWIARCSPVVAGWVKHVFPVPAQPRTMVNRDSPFKAYVPK